MKSGIVFNKLYKNYYMYNLNNSNYNAPKQKLLLIMLTNLGNNN